MSVKLKKLREVLEQRGLDGFIVPYRNEFFADAAISCSERLKWITGFSGSSGLALIFKKNAYLIVDGRYTLGAKEEVDLQDFQIIDIADFDLISVIEKNMGFRGKLSYDSRLHSLKNIGFIKQACEKAGGYLFSLKRNLIDELWEDRPKPPNTAVFLHDEQFSGLSVFQKIKLLTAKLEKNKSDVAVLKNPVDICWLLNVRANDTAYTPLALSSALIYTSGMVDWFIDADRIPDTVKTYLGGKVRILPPGIFEAEVSRLAKRRTAIYTDTESCTVWLENAVAVNGGQLVIGENLCAELKAIKNKTEINGMKSAAEKDGAALCTFLAYMDENGGVQDLNEYQAAAYLQDLRSKQPLFFSLSFPTISAFAANAAIVHYTPKASDSAKIQTGQVYLLDSGGQYLDGTTDITRTIAISKNNGQDIDEEIKRRYTQVLKGHIALANSTFPVGTYGNRLDTLARQFLWEDGADYAHGTGHGVGCFSGVHEAPPSISVAADAIPLQEGMIVTDEPGYYKEGSFGIRIENMLLVKQKTTDNKTPMLGFEVLTLAPFDKKLILSENLTDKEKLWINEYHRRILDTLKDKVDKKTLMWLTSAAKDI